VDDRGKRPTRRELLRMRGVRITPDSHVCYERGSRYYICGFDALGGILMKKPSKSNAVGNSANRSADVEFRTQYPHVTEYLENTTYDDGSPRQPSALSLFVEDGNCKVALNDKDCQQSLYVTAQTFTECLCLLEECLATNRVVWRPWKRPGRK
jgi:hypothetical protein